MALPQSSTYSLFLFVLLFVPSCSCFFDPRRHLPQPWVIEFDEDSEDFMQTSTKKPWISIDQHALTETLANTPGFKMASAILQRQRCRLKYLILVEEIYKPRFSETKLFIPNCNAITIYIRPLNNETQILENYPDMVDDLLSGRRHVVKQYVKKVTRYYDIGINVSVSHPFIYSNEEGTVIVHGADDEGFRALESQTNNLSFYSSCRQPDPCGREGMRSRGLGIDIVEFPLTKDEEVDINKMSMKIEMVIVVKIVPFRRKYDYAPGSDDWKRLNLMYGSVENAMDWFKQMDRPYEMTMNYVLHF